MSTFKKCAVVVLPSDEKKIVPGRLCLHAGPSTMGMSRMIVSKDTTTVLNEELNMESVKKGWYQPQHIYILSYERPQSGDWCFVPAIILDVLPSQINRVVKISDDAMIADRQITVLESTGHPCTIIATTDESIPEGVRWSKPWTFPKPDYQFLEQYAESCNNGNPIANIEVEHNENYPETDESNNITIRFI